MNLKKNKIFIILFSCLIISLIFSLKVNAANADITVDKTSVELGESVKITVSGKAVQWNLKLKADGELLKTDSELENYEANKDISFSVTYTPKTAGTKEITLEGSATEFSDGSTVKTFTPRSITVKEKETKPEEKPPVEQENPTTPETPTQPSNPSTPTTPEIPVEKPKEKSKNAYLKTLGVRIKPDLAEELGVETNEYDFSGFSKKKTSYNVTVPYDVDYLKVEYKADDSNASVKVTGNSGFEVGSKNKITIKVTAEDGKTTETYTIKVTKLAKEEEKPGNVIEKEEEGLYLTSLELDGIQLLPVFAKDTYSYTATLDNVTNKDIEVNAKANKENANIEITGNTNLALGENTINIVLTMPDSTVQTVYQIVLTANLVEQEVDVETDISTTTDFMGAITKYVGIAIAVVVLIIVLVIVLIILLRRENKRLREENEEELEETKAEEYNVYENDENEFNPKDTEENEERYVEYISNKTETKNVRRRSRREKGKHSK